MSCRSSQLPVRISPSEYGLATKILTNFYNYLLLHDVFCKTTEGDLIDSIKAARDVCALAADELPRVSQAGLLLPGDFNVAASVLTGGHFEGLFAGDSAWAKETQENIYGDEVWGSSGGAGPGMPDSKARLVLAMGIMVNGSQELYEDMIALEGDWHCHLVVAKTKSIGLEITRIEFPEAEARSLYQDDEMRKKVTLQPVGKLFCKEWHAPDFFQTWDLAPRSTDGDGQEAEYEFWTEENILTTLFVGMKMEATIRRLQLDEDTGFWQLDTVSRAYCSFFTYLPNELVIKPIKTVEWAAEGEVGGEEEGAGVEE